MSDRRPSTADMDVLLHQGTVEGGRMHRRSGLGLSISNSEDPVVPMQPNEFIAYAQEELGEDRLSQRDEMNLRQYFDSMRVASISVMARPRRATRRPANVASASPPDMPLDQAFYMDSSHPSYDTIYPDMANALLHVDMDEEDFDNNNGGNSTEEDTEDDEGGPSSSTNRRMSPPRSPNQSADRQTPPDSAFTPPESAFTFAMSMPPSIASSVSSTRSSFDAQSPDAHMADMSDPPSELPARKKSRCGRRNSNASGQQSRASSFSSEVDTEHEQRGHKKAKYVRDPAMPQA